MALECGKLRATGVICWCFAHGGSSARGDAATLLRSSMRERALLGRMVCASRLGVPASRANGRRSSGFVQGDTVRRRIAGYRDDEAAGCRSGEISVAAALPSCRHAPPPPTLSHRGARASAGGLQDRREEVEAYERELNSMPPAALKALFDQERAIAWNEITSRAEREERGPGLPSNISDDGNSRCGLANGNSYSTRFSRECSWHGRGERV